MDWILTFNSLLLINVAVVGGLLFYLVTKIGKHRTALVLVAGLAPIFLLQLGCYLFSVWPNSIISARLIILATAAFPLAIVPVSQIVARIATPGKRRFLFLYHTIQVGVFIFFTSNILSGKVIEWVTAILEQPIILVASSWRFYFLNVIGASLFALVNFDRTLQHATTAQREWLKCVLIAFVSFAVYFSYLAVNIFLGSYVSFSMLQLGAVLILIGLTLLAYSFAKYPIWEVNIRVSRSMVFGGLSASGAVVYLVISGTLLDFLRSALPMDTAVLLPVAGFGLLIPFLLFYLSPSLHSRAKRIITRHFFRNKYDYRDLWMKFSQKSSGSLNIHDRLPRVGEFIAEAMFARQVAVWLRSPTTETFRLAYCHKPIIEKKDDFALHIDSRDMISQQETISLTTGEDVTMRTLPSSAHETLRTLGIDCLKPVVQNEELLALIGIGKQDVNSRATAEDEQFLASVSTQLGYLILTHKLSDELLLAREWDSFNRFASFILHDLKNLATLQGMTLDNAKHFGHKPDFIADAFATFQQTTEKMITLIASLSVQRGQFSLKQQPVNILEVIAHTFDDLRLNQRNGVQLRTEFPPSHELPAVSGDPELLRKAFTNLLLNAIQSLPRGEGAVEVAVAHTPRGRIIASIRDTGCGIAPEHLEKLFRPFQTTKENGIGIGLCHTRSIIEVHGGQIRIESRVNAGTKVEVELPTRA